MTNTINLDLPYLLSSQAQKHVTHNEALTALDALVQLSVVDRDRTAPPEAPADGERHIVASPASGVWAGKEATVAAFEGGGWRFYAPRPGWLAWCEADQGLLAYGVDGWTDVAGLVAGAIASLQNLDFLGVASTADSTNRLSVASAASLFNHAGGGHQLKVNKAAEGDTASLLFQDAFGGRAEIGLCGNDELQMKVSPDGSNWMPLKTLRRSAGS